MLKIRFLPSTLTNEKVHEVYNTFLKRLNKNYKLFAMLLEDRTLTVSFEKLGVIAGTSREMNITINMQLMERDPQLFEEVFGHELAHSLCHVIYTKVMGHGNEWQKAIKALEVNGSEFHDYNLDEFRLPNQKIYLYKCRCRQHKISQESHENSQGQNRICHLCNSKAVLMG